MTYTFADYLLHLFYLIDTEFEALDLPRLRQRGPEPARSDAEAITIELAGEFLGVDGDEQIYEHFRRYHAAEFPALTLICRTTFARQCANLWRVKQLLHARLLGRMPLSRDPDDGSADCWLVDSFPLRVCRLRRVPRSKLFKGQAAYGHDPAQGRDRFYGFRVHVRCDRRGPLAQVELTAANVADLDAVRALAPPPDAPGPLSGDRTYWPRDPGRLGDLARAGIDLLAPFKKATSDPNPGRSSALNRVRRRIETVIGQLAARFNAERTRARDLWHLCSRLTRKALSHTAAVLINWMAGNPPLQLDRLVEG